MREIKFRGKALGVNNWAEKNKWVYGFYIGDSQYSDFEESYLVVNCRNIPVSPKTVGQYTGLKDSNGKEIYEGDIVKLTDTVVGVTRKAVIEFGNPNRLYDWGWQLRPLTKKPFAVEILLWVGVEKSGAYCEIIGNIYDNPELLEK